MTHYIFRQYPALGQAAIAQELMKEGWFDQEGWTIASGGGKPVWFRDANNIEQELTVGGKSAKYSAAAAWKESYDRFVQYGRYTQMLMVEAKRGDPLRERYRALLKKAKLYKQRGSSASLPERDSDMGRSLRAGEILRQLDHYRTLTNFENHYWEADAYIYQEKGQSVPLAIQAQKNYFKADILWKEDPQSSIEHYEKWIEQWKRLLEKKRHFRDNTIIQEDCYEQQLKYLSRYQEHHKADLQKLLMTVAQAALVLPMVRPSPRVQIAEQVGLCASTGPGLWSKLVAFRPHPEVPLTLERMLTRDQKARIIKTKKIWGPLDSLDFDPDLVERVRFRIMYPGKQPPSRRRIPANMRRPPVRMPARGPQVR
jgi:hypothetical protein